MTEPMKTELLERIKDTVINMREPERTIHLEKLLELHGEKSMSAERERIKDTLNKVQGSWSYQQVIELIDSM